MRNQDAFNGVAEYVRIFPENYHQHRWVSKSDCGSAFCIAGTTVFLEEGENIFSEEYGTWQDDQFFPHDTPSNNKIADKAQKILGLEALESYVLFDGGWKPKDGLTVPEALEKLGAGAHLKDVTRDGYYDDEGWAALPSSHI